MYDVPQNLGNPKTMYLDFTVCGLQVELMRVYTPYNLC